MASPVTSMSSCNIVSSGFDSRRCSGSFRADRERISTLSLSRSRVDEKFQKKTFSSKTKNKTFDFRSSSNQRMVVQATASAEKFSSPKMGALGESRFRENASPGTYWGESQEGGQGVTVVFDTGDDKVEVTAKAGENLLRVAEKCGVLVPTTDFCYEGTCCHCEMEVEGGAPEVGYRANTSSEALVRSCICPVPLREGSLRVRILSEESAWDDVL